MADVHWAVAKVCKRMLYESYKELVEESKSRLGKQPICDDVREWLTEAKQLDECGIDEPNYITKMDAKIQEQICEEYGRMVEKVRRDITKERQKAAEAKNK
jgi:hypothetical protein